MPAVTITSAKRIRTFVITQALATASTSLVTSGAGLVFSVTATTTATAGAATYISLYDATAAGTACYDYVTTATGATRLLCLFQSSHYSGTAPTAPINLGPVLFQEPIPFFDGLVVGATNHLGTAVGATSLNIVVQLYAPRTI